MLRLSTLTIIFGLPLPRLPRGSVRKRRHLSHKAPAENSQSIRQSYLHDTARDSYVYRMIIPHRRQWSFLPTGSVNLLTSFSAIKLAAASYQSSPLCLLQLRVFIFPSFDQFYRSDTSLQNQVAVFLMYNYVYGSLPLSPPRFEHLRRHAQHVLRKLNNAVV